MESKLGVLFFCLFFQFTASAASLYEVPSSVKVKYAPLYSLKVESLSDGSFAFGPARRFTRRGINVLYLKGDRFEMAFQHGKLLGPEIQQGALGEAAAGLGHNAMEVMGDNLISRIVVKFFYASITDKMYKYALTNPVAAAVNPQEDAWGLSESTGLDVKSIINAALSTESATVLLGKNLNGHLFATSGSSPNECSSFVTWGGGTASGEILIGRNTDYWLNGSFDRFPTVVYYNPTNGVQKYMTVTSAGVHNAGVVGMNESGLYVDVHTIPTKDVSSEGIPVFMIAQEVLRSSKSFEDALANFKKAKPGAGWTYVLVSTKERKAATIEMSNTKTAVRPLSGDTLVQTNHYMTPEMQTRFEEVNPSTVGDSHARYDRIAEMLAQGRGKLDERSAAAILGDKWDVTAKRTAWLGNTVAVHTTMTSVVVQPDRGRLFVANGTAPVSQTEYVEVPTIASFDLASFQGASYDHFPNDSFKVQHPDMAAAEQAFIQAKIAYERDLDLAKSATHLREAIALDPTTPGTQFLLAMLEIRLDESAEAEALLQGLVEKFPGHYRNLGHYYLARLYGSEKRRGDAAGQLSELVASADPKVEGKLLAAAAKYGKKLRRFVAKKGFGMMDLPVMFQQADMITYQ